MCVQSAGLARSGGAGGAFSTIICGPDGERIANEGVFLEVLEPERIVFTSVLGPGWRPLSSELPFTAVITLAEIDGGTRYTATAMHQTAEHCRRHADMGFHDGWGAAIDQLETLARAI